jgi:hypothetical protein
MKGSEVKGVHKDLQQDENQLVGGIVEGVADKK